MNEGFFSREQTTPKNTSRLSNREACGSCGLHSQCKTPRMPVSGDGNKRILIIGECPGKPEDDMGEPMTGRCAGLLRKVFYQNGIDVDRDCWKINALSCYPGRDDKGGTKTPTQVQIAACRPRVWNFIKKEKPHMIFLLGTAAVQSFLGHRWTKQLDGIAKWRGWTIPDRDVKAWVFPIFHPAYVQYMEKTPSVETIWIQDINRALSYVGAPLPYYVPERDCIEILEGRGLYDRLAKLLKGSFMDFDIAIDYETTGLKPHRPGHQIVTCAIADSDSSCFAFDWPRDERTLQLIRSVFTSPIGKIAANMKYEDTWTKWFLKVQMNNWVHDTMLTAHLLDNRPHITGLKFQAYVRFGVLPYDEHISPFLKGVDSKDANSFNRILEAPRKEILIYNGYDSLLEFRLAELQRKQMFGGNASRDMRYDQRGKD